MQPCETTPVWRHWMDRRDRLKKMTVLSGTLDCTRSNTSDVHKKSFFSLWYRNILYYFEFSFGTDIFRQFQHQPINLCRFSFSCPSCLWCCNRGPSFPGKSGGLSINHLASNYSAQLCAIETFLSLSCFFDFLPLSQPVSLILPSRKSLTLMFTESSLLSNAVLGDSCTGTYLILQIPLKESVFPFYRWKIVIQQHL